MGLFGNLMQKIFRGSANAEAPEDALRPGQAVPESRVQAAQRQGVPVAQAVPGAPANPGIQQAPGTAQGPVDIAAVLDGMAKNNPEKLDWKHSIVDLMKLVGLDSDYASRKELAEELGNTDYTGSAEDNIRLHKQVMGELARNGGKVPAEFLD